MNFILEIVRGSRFSKKGLFAMLEISISKELARQFAYECFDEIVSAVKTDDENRQCMDEDQQKAS